MAVYRRRNVWWYDFRIAGARVRESTRATTRAAALHAEALRKAELLLGRGRLPGSNSSVRFKDFAYGDFSRWCANEHREHPSAYARYMRTIKPLSELFGDRLLDEIDSGLVEQYKLRRSSQPRKHARWKRAVSPAAVNRELAVLRLLFNFAIRLRLASKNPVAGVRFFPEDNTRMRVLSFEEEQRYLSAASPMLRDVAVVMLETGMRPGEVSKLSKDDFDLSNKWIHVRQGKTRSARRHIPLTDRALRVLSSRATNAPNGWLFPCPQNPSQPLGEVRKAHNAAVVRAGIQPPFRLYDLRHTALTRMAMAGIDLATLKEIAGHSQIQMTMRYVHPTPQHKRQAIKQFEDFSISISRGAESSSAL